MAIDVGVLKQVQTALTQLLASIAGVLDSLAAEADLDRSIAAKRKELSDLAAKIDSEAKLGEERLASANTMIKQEQQRLEDIKKAIRNEREAAVAAAKLEGELKAAAMSDLEDKLSTLNSSYSDLQSKHDAKVRELEMIVAARKAELEAEVNLLINRKEAAVSALDALRLKLG